MADPESPLINVGAPENRDRNSRACKVAAVTLLACTLLVGQAMLIYVFMGEKSEIKSLKEETSNLRDDMDRARSGSYVIQKNMASNPMLPVLYNMDKEESPRAESSSFAPKLSSCQLEALGLKKTQLPNFRPSCDERGLYQARQCFLQVCWCVNPDTGDQIRGTMMSGEPKCGTQVHAGRLTNILAAPQLEE